MGFTAGQQAYADFFELTENEALVKQLQWDAVENGIGCNSIKEGDFNICYFICTRYNFWEDCSDHPGLPTFSLIPLLTSPPPPPASSVSPGDAFMDGHLYLDGCPPVHSTCG